MLTRNWIKCSVKYKEDKMKQKVLIIQADVPMNGFCYDFSKALFEKLKKLQKEDRIFEEGLKQAKYDSDIKIMAKLTDIAGTVLKQLNEQILFVDTVGERRYPQMIDDIMEVVEEFLAIFEKNKK